MKKNLCCILPMLASLLLLFSCQPENGNGGGGGNAQAGVFSVTMPAFGDGITVDAPAQAGLFSGGELFALTAGDDGTYAGEEIPSAAEYQVFIPYDGEAVLSDGLIETTLPSVQRAVRGGIDPAAALAVASTRGAEVALRPAVGLLKLTLSSDYHIKSLTIKSRGTETLAGTLTVRATNAAVTVKNGSRQVELANGGVLEKGDYYVCVTKATYVDGLEITVADEFGRVALVRSEEFITVSAGGVLDLGAVDADVEFEVPSLELTPFDVSAPGDGGVSEATLSAPLSELEIKSKPDWVTAVSVEGKTLRVTTAANEPEGNDDKNRFARYGRVAVEGMSTDGPAKVEFLIGQAAKGFQMTWDSFSGPELADNWKGNWTRAQGKYGEGHMDLVGTNDEWNGYPMYNYNAKMRLQYDEQKWNAYIVSVDVSAGQGGLIMFNQHGYDGDTYNFKGQGQCYVAFLPFTSGASNFGFYCLNTVGPNALDASINLPEGEEMPEWVRLEITNIDRGDCPYTIHDTWSSVHVFALREVDGILVQDKKIWGRELRWYSDAPALGYEYGYFGVFSKGTNMTMFRNFTFQYTDYQK